MANYSLLQADMNGWRVYRKNFPAYKLPPGEKIGIYAARVFGVSFNLAGFSPSDLIDMPHFGKLRVRDDGRHFGQLDEDEIDEIVAWVDRVAGENSHG